jgi:GTPase
MAFRDILEIEVIAGNGGDGAMSFHRAKYMPKGGADGGHGGTGGTVFLRAVNNVTSLEELVGRRKYRAENGRYGEGRLRSGADGLDLTVDVPVGTTAFDAKTGRVIADLIEVGQVKIVARGGHGGKGNSAFVTSTRQAPRFAELGVPGPRRSIRLELRLIADVGLVGYPNAGKSSLLAQVSRANPEIAAYPFTTLSPILGVVERGDYNALERFTLADIPGIIEGASEGKGLGLEFLRHISRTRLLVYVLSAVEDPVNDLKALQNELNSFDPSLLESAALITLNKVDLIDDETRDQLIKDLQPFGLPIAPMSALEGTGLEKVKDTLFELLPSRESWAATHSMIEESEEVKIPPLSLELVETEEERIWIVTGGRYEERLRKFSRYLGEALEYLQNVFKRDGLYSALEKKGVKPGDTIKIGTHAFEYFQDLHVKEKK